MRPAFQEVSTYRPLRGQRGVRVVIYDTGTEMKGTEGSSARVSIR